MNTTQTIVALFIVAMLMTLFYSIGTQDGAAGCVRAQLVDPS